MTMTIDERWDMYMEPIWRIDQMSPEPMSDWLAELVREESQNQDASHFPEQEAVNHQEPDDATNATLEDEKARRSRKRTINKWGKFSPQLLDDTQEIDNTKSEKEQAVKRISSSEPMLKESYPRKRARPLRLETEHTNENEQQIAEDNARRAENVRRRYNKLTPEQRQKTLLRKREEYRKRRDKELELFSIPVGNVTEENIEEATRITERKIRNAANDLERRRMKRKEKILEKERIAKIEHGDGKSGTTQICLEAQFSNPNRGMGEYNLQPTSSQLPEPHVPARQCDEAGKDHLDPNHNICIRAYELDPNLSQQVFCQAEDQYQDPILDRNQMTRLRQRERQRTIREEEKKLLSIPLSKITPEDVQKACGIMERNVRRIQQQRERSWNKWKAKNREKETIACCQDKTYDQSWSPDSINDSSSWNNDPLFHNSIELQYETAGHFETKLLEFVGTIPAYKLQLISC